MDRPSIFGSYLEVSVYQSEFEPLKCLLTLDLRKIIGLY